MFIPLSKTINNDPLSIIDMTLVEVNRLTDSLDRLNVINFCKALKVLGIDLIEVDSDILMKIDRISSEYNLIIKMQQKSDIEVMKKYKIKDCIINKNMYMDKEFINGLYFEGFNIKLELAIEELENFIALATKNSMGDIKKIKSIRLYGINQLMDISKQIDFYDFCKSKNISSDICPTNEYYCATSIAVDNSINGINTITASVLGFGVNNEYAALEEFITAINVITDRESNINFKALPQVCKAMLELSKVEIVDSKPIFGQDIFKYESGVHADGINKNPFTYEPFDPDMIGQKRQLSIGKHSGKQSVIGKLKALGVQFNISDIQDILNSIRENSISFRRSLSDEEIIECARYYHGS